MKKSKNKIYFFNGQKIKKIFAKEWVLILIVFLLLDVLMPSVVFWTKYLNIKPTKLDKQSFLNVRQGPLNVFLQEREKRESALSNQEWKEFADIFSGFKEEKSEIATTSEDFLTPSEP